MCDGSAVSRTTYSALFAIVSTTWGAGDGSTTFNVPDMRGRVAVGIGTHSDVNAAGLSDGMATVGDRRPKHKTSITDPTHAHSYTAPGGATAGNPGGGIPAGAVGAGTSAASTGITAGIQTNAPTDTVAYLVVPFIIKT
jgi:microcystin-dependent protein